MDAVCCGVSEPAWTWPKLFSLLKNAKPFTSTRQKAQGRGLLVENIHSMSGNFWENELRGSWTARLIVIIRGKSKSRRGLLPSYPASKRALRFSVLPAQDWSRFPYRVVWNEVANDADYTFFVVESGIELVGNFLQAQGLLWATLYARCCRALTAILRITFGFLFTRKILTLSRLWAILHNIPSAVNNQVSL